MQFQVILEIKKPFSEITFLFVVVKKLLQVDI